MSRRLELVTLLSFVPFAVKAAGYLPLGSFVPAIVWLALAGLVVSGFRHGEPRRGRAVRIWSASLVLWACLRLGLIVLFALAPLREAHVESQFTATYVAWSLLHLAAGVYLWRSARTP